MPLPVFLALAGAVVGGINARNQAKAAYLSQQVNFDYQQFQEGIDADAQARQYAYLESARVARNQYIARAANQNRAIAEFQTAEQHAHQTKNLVNASRYKRSQLRAHLSSKTAQGSSIRQHMVSSQKEFADRVGVLALEKDRTMQNILQQQENALAQRDFSYQEQGWHMPGIGPMKPGSGAMWGGMTSGASTGLQLGAGIDTYMMKGKPNAEG